MKKIVKIMNLDCANCAQELEHAISKIEGVNEVSIHFMTQKMTIDITDEKYDKVIQAIEKAKKKVEPDCEIVGL